MNMLLQEWGDEDDGEEEGKRIGLAGSPERRQPSRAAAVVASAAVRKLAMDSCRKYDDDDEEGADA